MSNAERIRQTIEAMLAERGQSSEVADSDSLFTSGRLDSLAATQVLLLLEGDFGIDLADADFDISRLDTIADLQQLVAGR
ncbi:MAG: phosphopantetheine-binding protein [Mesorhizobium sp.]